MLHIEEENIKKINILLDLFNLDINKIKYIQKDNILYEDKKPMKDILTHLISTYGAISDIYLKFDITKKSISIHARNLDKMFNTDINIDCNNNYNKATYKSISYDIKLLKPMIHGLINEIRNIEDNKDLLEFVNIPSHGNYRLRSLILNGGCLIRLIPIDNQHIKPSILKINNNYIKSQIYDNINILNLDETISYTVEVDINGHIILENNRIELPDNIKNKINTYYNVMKKMFETHKNSIDFYRLDKIKLKIEYKNEENIKISFDHDYYIDRKEMDEKIIDYILKNNKDFYNPIFNSFIEEVIQEKLELENGCFKSTDELKDCLLVSKIQRI